MKKVVDGCEVEILKVKGMEVGSFYYRAVIDGSFKDTAPRPTAEKAMENARRTIIAMHRIVPKEIEIEEKRDLVKCGCGEMVARSMMVPDFSGGMVCAECERKL